MQCRRQPIFLEGKPIHISNLIEIRLAPAQWNRIKAAARKRHRTYSTISRYCVLRLARKCSLRWTKRLEKTRREVEKGLPVAPDLHRHMMCLYGDDEKIIRLAAMDLGLTMTAFARLAIELYLPLLAMEKQSRRSLSDQDLTAEGIRFSETIQIFADNAGPYPLLRTLHCTSYPLESYW
ncbi:MAG: hypothetical protein OHK0011_19890 [Turneriella sp.]